MNPSMYGSPPLQQPYGGGVMPRYPGPPQGAPPGPYNGLDSSGYEPQNKSASQLLQNGPPMSLGAQNRPMRPSYPPGDGSVSKAVCPPGPPMPGGPRMPVNPDQISQQMGSLSLSQPGPYGSNYPPSNQPGPPLPNQPPAYNMPPNNNYPKGPSGGFINNHSSAGLPNHSMPLRPPAPGGPSPMSRPPGPSNVYQGLNSGPPMGQYPSTPGMASHPNQTPPLTNISNPPGLGGPTYPSAVQQPNFSGPPGPIQNFSGPPGPIQNFSDPPGPNQNFSGPPGPHQNFSGPPGLNQNFSGPPGPNQNFSGPPGPNQNFSGIPGQTNGPQSGYGHAGGMQNRYPGPPGQQPYPGQPGAYQGQGVGPVGGHMPLPGRVAGSLNTQNQQPAKRLDPDQMPSPIQVIEDDKKNKSGDFYTNTKGLVPPLVTTNFVVHDEGNCSPRFMRSTIYSIPTTPDMLKQASVPFAISVSPFARIVEGESPPPISDLGETGPVRCNRCKAYMCALMQFIDGGRRFQCVFCKGTTEVPPEYFAHLDHMGQRVDKFQRPELCLGSFEYVATKEYCRNKEFPKPPAFIFMIEVSFSSFKSGMVHLLCQNLKRVLAGLPRDVGQEKSAIKVGFVTYGSVLHFYNVKGNLAQPQMMVVPDVNEMFVPLVDGFLVNLEESEIVIDSLLEQIPQLFAETRETEIVLGPVIQAGLEALKAADCSGKLFIFHTSLPTAEAPGKLKNRDDRKLLGTEKEKSILGPQTTFYNNLGQECVAASCCVDIFLFPNAYVDVATISQVTKLTGGQVYKYAYFQADIDGPRFLEDLTRDIEKQIAFEAVMRVRTSTGIRPTDFFGNYFMANTTDVELAAIDCDKALAVEIKYDDKLSEEDGAYVQTAVLYTSCGGQRRLRVHNLAMNTCSQMADLYRSCELDTVINFLAKLTLRQLLEQNPRQVKESLISRGAQILASYRKNCASPSSTGQLILPECMKLLPLYINCLLKNDALAGGSDMAVDDRCYSMANLNSMNILNSVGYFYPRLIPLHDLDVDSTEMPVPLRCSVEKVRENGAYLLENGQYMFLWLGQGLASDWIQDVLGVPSTARVDPEKAILMELNTPMSKRVRGIISDIKNERNRSMKMVIVRQGDKLELVFRQFLVEDRTGEASVSYVDFLCHLHKEIRSILN